MILVNTQVLLYETGALVDDSKARNQTFSFALGHGEVIQGWDQGLLRFASTEFGTVLVD